MLNLKEKNKRGDVSDGIMFVILVFYLAVSFLIVGFTNSKLKQIIQTTVLNSTSTSERVINQFSLIENPGMNKAFVLLFAFLIIQMMVTAYLVRVHPIWMFIYLVTTGIAIFLAAMTANAYSAMIQNVQLAVISAQQPQILWVMKHIVKIVIGAVGLSLIILFAKPQYGGNPI